MTKEFQITIDSFTDLEFIEGVPIAFEVEFHSKADYSILIEKFAFDVNFIAQAKIDLVLASG